MSTNTETRLERAARRIAYVEVQIGPKFENDDEPCLEWGGYDAETSWGSVLQNELDTAAEEGLDHRELMEATRREREKLEAQAEAAAQHRAAAAEARQRSAESFERCDTDGFATQAAASLTARVEEARARITEAGGRSVFAGLYEGDRRVVAKQIRTRFGWTWILGEVEASRFGRRFVPVGEGSRIQKALGLRERAELAPAWADVGSPPGATGFSGLGSCYVEIFRTGDAWGSDAELVR